MLCERISIEGKNIYIVEDHHHVLEAWAEYRKKVNLAPMLITLDHHTDTHSAFLHYSYNSKTDKLDNKKAKELLCSIDYKVDETVNRAISKLRNDEHIDAAITSRIISKAFVISYQAHCDKPQSYEESFRVQNYYENMIRRMMAKDEMKYISKKDEKKYPESEIYEVGSTCAIGCQRAPHNDDCIIPHYNQAIESILLDDKLKTICEMCPDCIKGNLFDKEYILDIDLDYFHTCKSIQPENIETFYELIRNAKIITIALEPFFVEEWKQYDEDIDCEFLKEKLLEHIKKALS
ncbi:UPF0489 family protein [Clostridium algidicarnis]|uniref:UPF0489 family protein n=1 Tax=Clostridium algidicarnis TaxID=37659 RepID=UPI003FD70F36